MLLYLLLLISFGFSCQAWDPKEYGINCGFQYRPEKRIFNGKPLAYEDEYPWLVDIQPHEFSEQTQKWEVIPGQACNGVLLNDIYVLTTKKCRAIYGNIKYKIILGVDPYNEPVYEVGDDDLTDIGNITLIKIPKHVSWSRAREPICLPPADREVDFNQVNKLDSPINETISVIKPDSIVVASYGGIQSQETDLKQREKRQFTGHILTRSDCKKKLLTDLEEDYGPDYPYPDQLCVSRGESDSGSCWQDIGAPVMVQISNGRWHVIGIVFGKTSESCTSGPTVYTRIDVYSYKLREIILAPRLQ